MKTDILATIDAVLAENRDVKRQRMFAKVMDLLDNPTQCPVPTDHLIDASVFFELPGEAERVDHHSAYYWRTGVRYEEMHDETPGLCITEWCYSLRAPDRLLCRFCCAESDEPWGTGADHRTDAAWLK